MLRRARGDRYKSRYITVLFSLVHYCYIMIQLALIGFYCARFKIVTAKKFENALVKRT